MEWMNGLGMISSAIAWRDFGTSIGIMAAAWLVGLLCHAMIFWFLGKIANRTSGTWDNRILESFAAPSRFLFPLLLLKISQTAIKLPPRILEVLSHSLSLLFLAAVSFLCVRSIRLLGDFLLSRYDLKAVDNLSARKVHTQVKVLEKALLSIVAVATVAFMLMTFDGIRQVGISILASAGLAGVIIGLAAQKSIGTLLAGFQIAITQPIRMDDVVIVEGEWGRVEEITLTYVVIRIWDLRRLIVPITYFIEEPFQNWTRSSSEILGSIFIFTDYRIQVDEVRDEMDRVVKASPLWDGKVCGLQVTDCKESALELRLLISSASASEAWDLRCHVREKIIGFIQSRFPESLPRVRAEWVTPSRIPESEAGQMDSARPTKFSQAET
jgi:small-conductance mechanosensitive channel